MTNGKPLSAYQNQELRGSFETDDNTLTQIFSVCVNRMVTFQFN